MAVYLAGFSEKTFKVLPEFHLQIPNGGESWNAGEHQKIRWETVGKTSKVLLQYLAIPRDEGAPAKWQSIGKEHANTGVYDWLVRCQPAGSYRAGCWTGGGAF